VDTVGLVTASRLDADSSPLTEIGDRRFSPARKGYDREEVRQFLGHVGEQVNQLRGEVEWLRARCEHLERRTSAAQEAAYARLSRDFMDVVQRADEAAGRVRAEAESQARGEVDAAHREAGRLLAAATEQAEMILTQARAEAERVLREVAVVRPEAGPRPALLETFSASETATRPPRRAQPDEPDLDLEIDASLFDLFDDPD
jgi:DivIVA domain-containing protein